MYTLIKNCRLFSDTKKQDILVKDEKIVQISDKIEVSEQNNIIIDAKNKIVTTGLIEQHIHGGYGVDFNLASEDEIQELMKRLPCHGITTIIPTVMTAPINVIKEQTVKIKTVKTKQPKNSTQIEGIHFEGPCLCSKYKGIQPESNIIVPNIDNFKLIEDDIVKIVSYAPELDEDFKLTEYLAEKGIIPSAGHTSADYDTIKQAVSHGLKQITHTFNAMSPLHHRNPGILGQALTNDNIYVEVIADGMHIHKAVIDILLRSKPDSKVLFVSDSLPLNNAPTDSVIFGGQKVFNRDGKALNADGTFAGSLKFLDSIIGLPQNLELTGFEKLIGYSSSNVANNLSLEDRNSIEIGKKADLVIWNQDYTVDATIINGEIAFKR